MTDLGPATTPPRTRPIRLPEGIALSLSDPPAALAGEKGTWRFEFELASDVAGGSELRLQVHARRNNRPDWHGLQVDDPDGDGYVSVLAPDGTAFETTAIDSDTLFLVRFNSPEGGLKAGTGITAVIAAEAPRISAMEKFLVVYRPDGPEDAGPVWNAETAPRIVAASTLRVVGGRTERLRAYCPSDARPGEAFEVLVRPEDRHANLSSDSPGELAAFVDGEPVEARRTGVEHSTCCRLCVSLPAAGVHRIRVADSTSGLEATANAVVCRDSRGPRLYWGMIHGHTEISDGTGSLDNYFRQMRDEAGLDFAATGDHDHDHETSDEMWDLTRGKVAEWNSPGRFVTFLGYEWAKWRRNGDGDRNVYYLAGDRPMYRSGEAGFPRPPDLFRALAGEEAIVIPHHTGHDGNFCDWKDHDARLERLVEIFQVRGSYECAAEEGNPVPEIAARAPFAPGFVRNALAMGWRVGFTAGGDDHMGHAGTEWAFPATGYSAGLMAVRAPELTRGELWRAIYDRRVIATTGARIVLDCTVAGHPMGSEIDAAAAPGAAARREVHVECRGTAAVERIDVIRNGEVIHSAAGGGQLDLDLAWVDDAPLADVLLPAAKHWPRAFCYYYVRAVQSDGHVAWASPVWIDPAD